MNKYDLILMMLSIFIFSQKLNGQINSIDDSTYYHNVSFVLKGGVNHAPIFYLSEKFETREGEDYLIHKLYDAETRMSYYFYIGAQYQLGRKFSLQTGANFIGHRMTLTYSRRWFNDYARFYRRERGVLEQEGWILNIPLFVTYSFGKRVRFEIGTGLHWIFLDQTTEIWDHTDYIFAKNTTGNEWEILEEPIYNGGSKKLVSILNTNKLGALFHTQISIPITTFTNLTVGAQYHQTFGKPAPPTVIKRQFIFETGFRFKLKYDSW